jgi:hypothetical protein
MIYLQNNDYGLETLEIWTKEPLEIGSTRMARAADRNWVCHWLNETTLMIAPEHEPGAWKPAHVYSHSNGGDVHSFVLEPSERESARLEALERTAELDLDEIKDAINAVEEQVAHLVADNLDRAPFDDLAAGLSQAHALLVAAKAGAAAHYDTSHPPQINEPCKLPSSRSR